VKKILLKKLICPACLPNEHPLEERITREEGNDIVSGTLVCPNCGIAYPIEEGIAVLLPPSQTTASSVPNKYETPPVVSSYLWSHYGDLLGEEMASDAYRKWADLMDPHPGLCLDVGCAVGRFTFEMSRKCDLAVGLDNSRAFIRTARVLMQDKRVDFPLKVEGHIQRPVQWVLPEDWPTEKAEFIVADAQALPFAAHTVASSASLNLVDKVPQPLRTLMEMNRVSLLKGAQFLFSDPFSWSEEAAEEKEWLGGQRSGPFSGRALDHIQELLKGQGGRLLPPWSVEKYGQIWWTIRTHANHYERIHSCFIKARR
jgi:uncharacterized protein YbaR (Trm112 family)/SAM-dependent methyltransferase